jgi:formate dehydrogenase major subunit
VKTTVDLTKLLPHDGEELLRERVGMLPNVASQRTKSLKARISGAKAHTSLCGYCAVGCSTLAYVSDDGKLLDVEGNPDSPINAGHLCPKGSALFGLTVNEARWTTVKYRAPYSDRYEERPLAWALERIAQLTKKTANATASASITRSASPRSAAQPSASKRTTCWAS